MHWCGLPPSSVDSSWCCWHRWSGGSTDEGVQPSITGLGRVTVPGGASDEDVAFFFEDNTDRPGLSVVVLGAVIAVVAALAWWRMRLRPAAIG